MIRRLISVCFGVILVFSICGFAQTAKDTLVTDVASVEAESTDAAGAKSESVETEKGIRPEEVEDSRPGSQRSINTYGIESTVKLM